MGRLLNIIAGQTFNRWTVVSRVKTDLRPITQYLCRCSCEKKAERILSGWLLKAGISKSCGCWLSERISLRNRTHGMYGTSEYRTWQSMLGRCHSKTHKSFWRYGGSGIFVCDRWRNSFENFYADMGPKPSPKHSIDRIDGTGSYTPENCRWATTGEQLRNRRVTRFIEFQGKKLTAKEWEPFSGVKPDTLLRRIKLGWTPERALTERIQSEKNWVRADLADAVGRNRRGFRRATMDRAKEAGGRVFLMVIR